jgi:hypothetical protein
MFFVMTQSVVHTSRIYINTDVVATFLKSAVVDKIGSFQNCSCCGHLSKPKLRMENVICGNMCPD